MESRRLLAALDDHFMTDDGAVLNIPLHGVLENDDIVPPTVELQVDFSQDNGSGSDPLQNGWNGFARPGNGNGSDPHTELYPSDALAGAGNSVSVTVDNPTHYRNRAAIDAGPFLAMSDLLSDNVLRNEPGTISLLLDDLLAGTYRVTTYHHATSLGGGEANISVTDADGSRTVATNVRPSVGTGPDEISMRTFLVRVDDNIGDGQVTIDFDVVADQLPGDAGDNWVFNGFELATVHETLSVVALNGEPTDVGQSVTLPSGAGLTLNADGSFTYDPTTSPLMQDLGDGMTAVDTFSYSVENEVGTSDSATVSVTVTALPGAGNDFYSTSSDAPLGIPAPGVLSNDTLPMSFRLDFSQDGGTGDDPLQADWNGFARPGDGNGSDTWEQLYVDDAFVGPGNSLTVQLLNPTHYRDRSAIVEGPFLGLSNLLSDNVLRNATGVMTLTIVGLRDGIYDITTYHHATTSGGGAADISVVDSDGFRSVATDVRPTFGTGPDSISTVTFPIRVEGGETVFIDFNVTSIQLPGDPGNNWILSGFEIQASALGVSAVDGEPADVGIAKVLPSGATVTLRADGGFDYDPTTSAELTALPLGATAVDTFDYTVVNQAGTTDSGTVAVTVVGPNNSPTATDDGYATDEDLSVSGNVITDDTGNGVDSDPDGSTLAILSVNGDPLGVGADVALSNGGILRLEADGSFLYDPSPWQSVGAGEIGTESFTYAVTDGLLGTAAATVTLTLSGDNDAPQALDDSYVVDADQLLTGNVIAGDEGVGADMDVDANDVLGVDFVNGEPGSVGVMTTLPSGAALTLNADGSFTYDPSTSSTFASLIAGESAEDEFSYGISDGHGGTATATVNIVVNGPIDLASPDVFETTDDVVLSVPTPGLVANDVAASPYESLVLADSPVLYYRASEISGTTAVNQGTLGSAFNATYLNTVNVGRPSFSANLGTAFEVLGDGGHLLVDSMLDATDFGGDGSYAVELWFNADQLKTQDVFRASQGNTTVFLELRSDGLIRFLHRLSGTSSEFISTLSYTPGQWHHLAIVNDAGMLSTYLDGERDPGSAIASGPLTGSFSVLSGVLDIGSIDRAFAGRIDELALYNRSLTEADLDARVDAATAVSSVVEVTSAQGEPLSDGSVTVNSDLGATVTVYADGHFDYDPATSATLQDLADGDTASDRFVYSSADSDGNSGAATVSITVTGVVGAGNDFASTDEDTSVTAMAPGVLSNDSLALSPDLRVDFSQSDDVPLQAGWSGFSRPGGDGNAAHTLPYPSDELAGTGNSLEVTLSNPTHYRDRPAIASGPHVGLSDLLSDNVLRNAVGTMTLTLEHLLDGEYVVTTYHHASSSGGGQADIAVTDAQGTHTAAQNVRPTFGTDPLSISTVSFPIRVDNAIDGGLVTIDFVVTAVTLPGDPNNNWVLNGFEVARVRAPFVAEVEGSDANVGQGVQIGSGATVTMQADGGYVYDPSTSAALQSLRAGDTDTDSFTYTVSNGKDLAEVAAVTVTVSGQNDRPTAEPVSATTDENAGLFQLDLLDTSIASDVDRDTVLVVSDFAQDIGGSSHDLTGEFTLVDGVLAFDTSFFDSLTAGETATLVFDYTVDDQEGLSNSTASSTISITVEGLNDAPTVSAGGPYDIQEGSSLTLDASGTSDPDAGDTLNYRWDIDGDGLYDENVVGANPTVTASQLASLGLDGLVPPASIQVSVEVDDGTTTEIGTATLTIHNVAPVVTIDGPAEAVPNQAVEFLFGVSDASELDQAAGFTLSVDWGDGTVDVVGPGAAAPVLLQHAFNPAIDPYEVSVTVLDKDGGSGSTSSSVTVQPVAKVGDDLFVGGSDEVNDRIIVTRQGGNAVGVRLNDRFFGPFDLSDQSTIFVFGGAGHDRITSNISLAMEVHGEDGNDYIAGGTGDDRVFAGDGRDVVLLNEGNNYADGGNDNDQIAGRSGADSIDGGAGNDQISGASGDDILSGGDGNDRISGGLGDDLLVGGRGNDILSGGFGNDLASGGLGNDRLLGGDGHDLLIGGDGVDGLQGEQGDDELAGGTASHDEDIAVMLQTLAEWSLHGDRSSLGDLMDDEVGDGLNGGAGVDVLNVGLVDRVTLGPSDRLFPL